MNGKETVSPSFCQRLFNFIIEGLTVQARKKSKLGSPSPTNHGKGDTKCSKMVHPDTQGVSGAKAEIEKADSSKSSELSSSSPSLRSLLEEDQEEDDKVVPPAQAVGEDERAEEGYVAEPTAMKKMVSINDIVEVHEATKKRKKSKSFDKSSSFAKLDGEDESKPLRSILKNPPNVDEHTDALVNENGI